MNIILKLSMPIWPLKPKGRSPLRILDSRLAIAGLIALSVAADGFARLNPPVNVDLGYLVAEEAALDWISTSGAGL